MKMKGFNFRAIWFGFKKKLKNYRRLDIEAIEFLMMRINNEVFWPLFMCK